MSEFSIFHYERNMRFSPGSNFVSPFWKLHNPYIQNIFRKFQDHIKVDPGLAILPIIAILCGVAIGLGTVALGLILMIRGRHGAMSSDDRGDMSSDDDGNMKR